MNVCITFYKTKMVSRIGVGMSLKGRVEDDDFMLGDSSNCFLLEEAMLNFRGRRHIR